jgi:phosphonate transport system substrate-binding protein
MKRVGILLLGWCALLAGSAFATERPPESSDALRFGIGPYAAVARTAQAWAPLLEYLGAQTGYTFVFETAPDIPTFERRLLAGRYEMVYVNPYHYDVCSRETGYCAFAKEKGGESRSVVIVRRDSRYRVLEDLEGASIAFPAPTAFVGTLIPWAELSARGIAPTPTYVGSRESVLLNVARGLCDAGAVSAAALETLEPGLREQLRVLWTSEAFPPYALAAHPRVPQDVVAAVRAALLAMHEDPEAASLLAGLGFEGFEAAEDAEWDPVRAMGLAPPPVGD